MRPRELKIEGFTCFADPVEIDFSDLDVFVITGPTGAGKTTIIDALCYALYGKIPRHSETTQLMSHNRDHLHVALEFSAGDARYRVLRSINVTRKTGRDGTERVTRAPSPVQFERLAAGEWVPVEGRVRAIDEEIERIVGLDFDAFQRCVVLPQGRFQEFLTGDRKKRQDILKDLLDIGVYEQVMAAANLRARDHARDAANIEQQLRNDFADATEEALDASRKELEAAVPALETAKRRREQLTRAGELAVTVVAARGRERERTEQHDATVKEIDEAKTLGEAGAQQLERLRKDVAGAEARLKKLTYDAALHRALHVARDKAGQLDAARTELAKAREAAADGTGVARAEAAVEAAAAARKQAEERRGVAVEQREAAQRADAAAHVRSALKPGDPCPVCGGTVGKVAERRPASALPAHEKAVKDAEASERKAIEGHRAAELALERARQQAQAAAATAARLETDVAQAEKALAALLPDSVKPEAGAIAAALAEQDEASAQAETLSATVASLRKQLDELEPLVARSGQEIAGLQARAAQLLEEAGAAKKEGDRAMTGLRKLAGEGEWKDVLALIDQKRDPRPALSSMLKDAVTEADTLTARKTSLEEHVRVIEQKIERAGELRESLEAARAEGALCKELGLLLRADQFQDFVVSSAMAVLAESATAHLETLHQRFALQVDGGEFQVIDHWQADQVRSARTLSGGETFVVSLALALALSERLPELRSAAAAALESLFLDEGFGTLDPETLETVINALEGLRSEARMVGIVTHVPELAQRIEDRITVIKSPAGSRVEVRT